MKKAAPPCARDRVVDFLGELGPRWGLPAEACRVHAYLYLLAKSVPDAELRAALGLSGPALARALAWLAEYRLAERAGADAWRTGSDPWELMLRALQERQRREVGPALDLLHECRRLALTEGGAQRTVAAQIGKLVGLAEDMAAINSQAQRLSPAAMRRMVGLGGFAPRVLERTLGTTSRRRIRS